jgi:hypothetical protein
MYVYMIVWMDKFNVYLSLLEHQRPWQRGIVVIPSASRTYYTGFESHKGVSFLVLYTYIAVLLSKLKMHCHCVYLRKINAFKKYISKNKFLKELLNLPWSTNVEEMFRNSTKRAHSNVHVIIS